MLLQKLSYYKISNLSLSWFESYLNNRTKQVTINGNESKTKTVQCGVPQGPILGPLLFLIFINDLPLYLKDSIRSADLYADDTTLYDIALDKNILEKNRLQALDLGLTT